LVVVILVPTGAWAARPLVTDDARIVEAHACQLETWAQLGSRASSDDVWFQPACNPTGHAEIAAGFALLESDTGAAHDEPAVVLQGKTLFRGPEAGRVAWGAAAGVLLNASSAGDRDTLNITYGYFPVTLDAGGPLVHVNIGTRYEDLGSRWLAIWGLGGELPLLDRLSALAEIYGDHSDKPFTQAGVRFWLVPARVQFDCTGGVQIGETSVNWFSVGMRLLSPPLW
jgi:hypothetical protein